MKNLATVVCAVGMLVGSAAAQDAVQWRAEDGGNGHWYAAVISKAPLSWTAARDSASGLGGHLATLTSAEENSWVYERVASSAQLWSGPQGPYLGAYRDTTLGCGSLCGWQWVTREVWGFSSWDPGNPSGGDEAFLHFGNTVPCWCPGPHWNDIADSNGSWPISAFITEWSADCNNDGIVDYGQIHSGELVDANLNNIPDCCEASVSCIPCEGDVSGNGVVDGVDLAAVLGAWGSSGKEEFSTDVNGDGIVNGADLATVLSGWGPCS
jgi:hypothetical protein